MQSATISGFARNIASVDCAVTEAHSTSTLHVCPRLVVIDQHTCSQNIPVRVCNLSAKVIKIHPKTTLCELQEAKPVRHWSPSSDKEHVHTPAEDVTLQQLGIEICKDGLADEEHERATVVIEKWKHIFSKGPTDLGHTDLVQHEIELSNPTPFKDPYRRIPPALYEEVREHLKEMLEMGAIRESGKRVLVQM